MGTSLGDPAGRVSVELGESFAGARVDRAVADALDAAGHPVSRSQLQRSFASGEVQCEGRPLKPSTRVEGTMRVEVQLPTAAPLARAFPEDLALSVLFEDEAILVVDKPPGMVAHVSVGHERGTLVNAVLHHLGVGAEELPVVEGNPGTRPGLVHRLDKDTSGVMVVAKTVEALRTLAEAFSRHDIDRRYRCFVRGVPGFEDKRVATGHARDPKDRRRFAPVKGAKRRAITRFRRVARWEKSAELTAELETGRTHQIRMHARFLGHPILGDLLYGREARDPKLRAASDLAGRQALHAELLGFDHPLSGERVRFESPLPADLAAMRAALV